MKNKINNSFKEEFTNIPTFISRIKKNLKAKRKASLISWSIFSVIIALTNIAILTISSIALKQVLDDYNADTTSADFASQVLPTALVSAVSISLFILSIIISIYQGRMKSNIYREAMNAIQYEYIRHTKDLKSSDADIKKNVDKIYHEAVKAKNKKSFKKVLLTILTGGDDE